MNADDDEIKFVDTHIKGKILATIVVTLIGLFVFFAPKPGARQPIETQQTFQVGGVSTETNLATTVVAETDKVEVITFRVEPRFALQPVETNDVQKDVKQ